jgi:uncharacterized protein (DUF2249 family)
VTEVTETVGAGAVASARRGLVRLSTAEAPGVRATLDVRPIPPAEKHLRIHETFDALDPGEAMILINDHDPKPLYYEFASERPGPIDWAYLEQGPEVWRVRIARR